MGTARIFKNAVIELLEGTKQNAKLVWSVCQGPRWVRIRKNSAVVENLVTHSLLACLKRIKGG